MSSFEHNGQNLNISKLEIAGRTNSPTPSPISTSAANSAQLVRPFALFVQDKVKNYCFFHVGTQTTKNVDIHNLYSSLYDGQAPNYRVYTHTHFSVSTAASSRSLQLAWSYWVKQQQQRCPENRAQ
jgi:hypothetical protein